MSYYTKNSSQDYAVNLNQASSNYTPANSSGYDCTLSVVTGAIDSSYRTGSSTIYTVLLDKYTVTVTMSGTYAANYKGTISVANTTHSDHGKSIVCDGSTMSWSFVAYYGDVLYVNAPSYSDGSYTYTCSYTIDYTVTGATTVAITCNSRGCATCSASTVCGSSSQCRTCSAYGSCSNASSGKCIMATCRRSSGQ